MTTPGGGGGPSLFAGASNINITSSMSQLIAHAPADERGLRLLDAEVAPNAILNAGGRADPVRCYPGTREEILSKIERWMEFGYREDRRIFWLSGPAGGGKSAIVQTLAENCIARRMIMANFFFFRVDGSRNHSRPVVATLLYQLLELLPSLIPLIDELISRDRLVFRKPLREQFISLIDGPVRAARHGTPDAPPIILLIDGLDECDSRPDLDFATRLEQTALLNALHELVTYPDSPFLALVASRVESHIMMAFNSLGRAHSSIYLNEDYHPERDICLYLTTELQRVKRTHPLGPFLPAEWPPLASIQRLVVKSSGQFLYASTCARFIADSPQSPSLSLDMVLNILPANGRSPSAEIDSMFSFILSRAQHWESVREMLALDAILQRSTDYPYDGIPLSTLDDTEDEIISFCQDLASVIEVAVTSRLLKIRFHHSSFPDFLHNQERSARFYVDLTGYAKTLTPRLLLRSVDPETLCVAIIVLHRVNEVTEPLTNALNHVPISPPLVSSELQRTLETTFFSTVDALYGFSPLYQRILALWRPILSQEGRPISDPFVDRESSQSEREEARVSLSVADEGLSNVHGDDLPPYSLHQRPPIMQDADRRGEIATDPPQYSERASLQVQPPGPARLGVQAAERGESVTHPLGGSIVPSPPETQASIQADLPSYTTTLPRVQVGLQHDPNARSIPELQVVPETMTVSTESELPRPSPGQSGQLEDEAKSGDHASSNSHNAGHEHRRGEHHHARIFGSTSNIVARDAQFQAGPSTIQNQSRDVRSTVSFFEGASGVTILDSLITVTEGPGRVTEGRPIDHLRRFEETVAFDAIGTADSQDNLVGCYPGTREKVISQIETWMAAGYREDRRIFWLSGPAGAGKSAIMKTVALHCVRDKKPMVNFFFSRTDPSRNHARPIFATLLHQLLELFPQSRPDFNRWLGQDPLVFRKPIRQQLLSFLSVPIPRSEWPIVLILDGLDECDPTPMLDDSTERQQIGLLLAISALVTAPESRFIALISCRDAHHLKAGFRTIGLTKSTIYLDDSFKPADDIRIYVAAELSRIKSTHELGEDLGAAWPSDRIIDDIVDKSSGQFLYAAVVIRFIGRSNKSPDFNMELIMNLRPVARDSPFAAIDTVYSFILHRAEYWSEASNVLALHTISRRIDRICTEGGQVLDPNLVLPLEAIPLAASGYSKVELKSFFSDLTSIIKITVENEEIQLQHYHASFEDFIYRKERAGSFYIDLARVTSRIASPLFSHHESFILAVAAMKLADQHNEALTAALKRGPAQDFEHPSAGLVSFSDFVFLPAVKFLYAEYDDELYTSICEEWRKWLRLPGGATSSRGEAPYVISHEPNRQPIIAEAGAVPLRSREAFQEDSVSSQREASLERMAHSPTSQVRLSETPDSNPPRSDNPQAERDALSHAHGQRPPHHIPNTLSSISNPASDVPSTTERRLGLPSTIGSGGEPGRVSTGARPPNADEPLARNGSQSTVAETSHHQRSVDILNPGTRPGHDGHGPSANTHIASAAPISTGDASSLPSASPANGFTVDATGGAPPQSPQPSQIHGDEHQEAMRSQHESTLPVGPFATGTHLAPVEAQVMSRADDAIKNSQPRAGRLSTWSRCKRCLHHLFCCMCCSTASSDAELALESIPLEHIVASEGE